MVRVWVEEAENQWFQKENELFFASKEAEMLKGGLKKMETYTN